MSRRQSPPARRPHRSINPILANRQQGKTTTLAKFLACLSIAALTGGNCVFVYSTGLDRAVEVVKASKNTIDWLRRTRHAQNSGYGKIRVAVDNARSYGIVNPSGTVNEIHARPRTVESCRGDNPSALIVDEIAFCKSEWYFRFLQPLTMVRSRRFSYITTPPLEGSWFTEVVDSIKRANADGDFHFKYVTHTLSCEACIAAGIAYKCVHNLGHIPPWKSILKMGQIKRLYPKRQQREFETEILGIPEESAGGYIDIKLLDALREKPRKPADFEYRTVYVAIDPLSHGVSEMGLCAIGYGANGETVILGTAAVGSRRPMLVEIKAVVATFLTKLRRHAGCELATLVPIVEW